MQQPAHIQGCPRTSQVTSSLPLAMGIFQTLAGKRVLKYINTFFKKCVHKSLGPKRARNPSNLALGLKHQSWHQGFAGTADQSWAGEVSHAR